ncbi:hypothetical protein L596_015999 [Steinernema carpocapsae]|uniref:Uncharacterized protein n=1 Tax=Steinernema carpocapsae TaxID=34508 RepID=A0A4U5NHM9_STECR|nr:hypothetical protein L596_015999 [Steinernema carpocapsae]
MRDEMENALRKARICQHYDNRLLPPPQLPAVLVASALLRMEACLPVAPLARSDLRPPRLEDAQRDWIFQNVEEARFGHYEKRPPPVLSRATKGLPGERFRRLSRPKPPDAGGSPHEMDESLKRRGAAEAGGGEYCIGREANRDDLILRINIKSMIYLIDTGQKMDETFQERLYCD